MVHRNTVCMKFSLHGVSQFVRWHRRGLGLLALCFALITGLGAALSPPTAPVALVVAARALPPGAALAASDLAVVMVNDEQVPDGAFTDPQQVIGRPLVISLTKNTPITTSVLTSESLTDHDAGEVLVPFRVRDADVAGLLRVGDRLTIVAASPEGISTTVAEHLRVARLPSSANGGLMSASSSSGALIVVTATRSVAQQVAAVSDQWLGVIIE